MTVLLRLAVNGVPGTWPVQCCNTFLSRARGRLGVPRAQASQAWRLQPCRAVHTCFMTAPIDVVFCDVGNTVLRVIVRMQPWRFAAVLAADSAWEFPAGAAANMRLDCGDRLTLCR